MKPTKQPNLKNATERGIRWNLKIKDLSNGNIRLAGHFFVCCAILLERTVIGWQKKE
jgi:hypothetical protein